MQLIDTYDIVGALVAINPKAAAFLQGAKGIGAAREFLGLSRNSKMPSWTLAIPAREACPRGGQLAKVAGTVCFGCYAAKGLDALPAAAVAKQRRWDVIIECLKTQRGTDMFVAAFVQAMRKETHFRWHSAGDLFSEDYAQLVARCIAETPWVDHWIPTRESRMAHWFERLSNVVFRVSDDMVDQQTNKHKGYTSGVHTVAPTRGVECQSYDNDGKCGDCRACWDKSVEHVSYRVH